MDNLKTFAKALANLMPAITEAINCRSDKELRKIKLIKIYEVNDIINNVLINIHNDITVRNKSAAHISTKHVQMFDMIMDRIEESNITMSSDMIKYIDQIQSVIANDLDNQVKNNETIERGMRYD